MNKKILITTLHRACNYGSVLQAYALTRYLSALGHDCRVIDYIPRRFRLKHRLGMTGHTKGPKKLAAMAARLFERRLFDRFIRRHIPLAGRRLYSAEDVRQAGLSADDYITGSDQVWNSAYNEGIDHVFYLDFADIRADASLIHKNHVGGATQPHDGRKKISYAASFGGGIAGEEGARISSLLNAFDAISVREVSALKTLDSMDIQGCTVLDPVFLLGAQQWRGIAGRQRTAKKRPYILVYRFGKDNGCMQLAREIANRMGCDVVSVATINAGGDGADRHNGFASPERFLALLDGCEYVVTNSFHGTCFAMIFNKPFAVFPRKYYNERIESILDITELRERLVAEDEALDRKLEKAVKPVDYARVNGIIREWRKASEEFLNVNL